MCVGKIGIKKTQDGEEARLQLVTFQVSEDTITMALFLLRLGARATKHDVGSTYVIDI